jgi:hypothetical protein
MFEDSETEEPEMRVAAALKTPDVDHVRKVTSCRSKRKSQPLISPMASAAKRRKISIAGTLIKKKIKFSSYIRKFRVEQLQSHI